MRPEKLRVVAENEPVAETSSARSPAPSSTSCTKASRRSSSCGPTTGTTLVAFHQNSERVSDAGVPGTRVRLVWDPEFNVVLGDEPALEKELSA